jgi:L-rhamnose mutarotase
MHVYPQFHDEYKKRHDEIWPELVEILKEHGARNYSIFLEPSSSLLFAYVEIRNEKDWNSIAETEVCKRWWAYMEDIMKTYPDQSPVCEELTPVFYMK